MAEHELNDPNVDAIGEQSASAFMPEVVPAEIDPLKLLAVPRNACLPAFGSMPCASSRSVSQEVWMFGWYAPVSVSIIVCAVPIGSPPDLFIVASDDLVAIT